MTAARSTIPRTRYSPDVPTFAPAELERIPAVEGVKFGVYRQLLALVHQRAPTFADLHAREPFLARMVRKYPGGLALVTVVEEDTRGELPDAEYRKASQRQIERYAGRFKCAAVVLEGSGVRFTLLRTLLRGMVMFTRDQVDYGFFADTRGAGALVERHFGDGAPSLDASTVMAVIEAIRTGPVCLPR